MKPISVTVRLKTAIRGEDTILSTYGGLLRVKEGEWQISYTEEAEGARSSTLLTLKEDRITLKKQGASCFSTVFLVGEEHRSLYSVGPLALDAVTRTHSLAVSSSGELPSAAWSYELTLGGETRSFSITLSLTNREVEE